MASKLPDPGEPSRAGQTLGKYRLLRRLGAGGMGVVFLAEDTILHRRVALKALTAPQARNAALVQRFLREARAAAGISHPNVVAIHDVHSDPKVAYLVMELLGRSLHDRLAAEGSLPWEEAVRVIVAAGRGLMAAHAAGLVHRDVKPANLLLGEDGVVKVADFGLVKRLDPRVSPLTTADNVLGSPHYMSPEQCRGESLDERSDVYSLGATLYHVLTGRVPYEAETTVGVLFAHCSAKLPDPRSHGADVPQHLVEVLHRSMGKSRTDRYPNMAAFVADLDRLLDSTPESLAPVVPPPLPQTLPMRRMRRPWGRRAVVAAVLVAAGGAVGWGVTWLASGPRETRAPRLPMATPWAEVLHALQAANPGWQGRAEPLVENGEVVGLKLTGVDLADLRPLAGLTRLESFTYDGGMNYDNKGKVSDLTPLAKLPLRQVNLKMCSVRQIAPLAGAPLEDLEIRAVPGSIDLRPVQDRPLRRFVLEGSLTDWQLLRRLTRLTELKLTNYEFHEVRLLEGMPLQRLQLYGSRVADLTPIRRAPIEWLDIRQCSEIKSLEPLRDCPLREVWLDDRLLHSPGVFDMLKCMKTMQLINDRTRSHW